MYVKKKIRDRVGERERRRESEIEREEDGGSKGNKEHKKI